MKQKKGLIIALVIIGIVLVFSAINSTYTSYKKNKGYESVETTCIEEYKNYRS